MFRVFYCLTVEHDLRFVVLAALLCIAAALTAVNTVQRAAATRGWQRWSWLAASGFVTGVGVWGTHFVAMLAYSPGIPVAYDPMLTAASVFVAIGVTGCGWAVAVTGGRRIHHLLGGAMVGLGIGAMHYTGMAAVVVGARMDWAFDLVAASLVLGALFGAAAVWTLCNARTAGRRILAAVLLVLGIVSLHFTAMGALTLTPDPALFHPTALSETLLAWTVAAGAMGVLAIGFVSAVFDQHLSDRRRYERNRMREFADATFEGLAIEKDGLIADVNARLPALLMVSAERIIGSPLSAFAYERGGIEAVESARSGAPQACRFVRGDGETIPVEILSREILLEGRPARVYAVRDVTERESAEAQILYMAHHDALTGLPNRVRLRERLDDALKDAAAAGGMVAVVCFDLDRFKEVNDIHGHAAGDRLLKRAAQRIQSRLRSNATAARFGGDEFVVVLPGVSGASAGIAFAERVIADVSAPYEIDGSVLTVGASAGVSIYPADGADADTLLSQADMALYRAKHEGRNAARTFEPGMDALLRERRRLEGDLRAAVATEAMEVYYQPQVNADTGQVVGFEALVRWNHPERGLVGPDDFIPLAEETGVILALGDWVLNQACSEAAAWPKPYRIAVNVSAVQFKQGNLVLAVETALKASGLDPARLELEITEGVLIDDGPRALEQLVRLKALGVRVAMDDFGTGYSSLSYLRSFPFDKIKIDRSFITGLMDNKESRAIVRATTALARDLGIGVVAEGVETLDDLDILRREKCVEIQGYLVSRPVRRGQMAEFFGDHPAHMDSFQIPRLRRDKTAS